jgi:ABC-2 type transport system ATP-binding protein
MAVRINTDTSARRENGRPAILAEELAKSFGDVQALDGIHLQAQEGTILGLLGPNGAGKTTAVRIFTTLLKPDGGRAEVAGFDVVRDAGQLRGAIGLAGQYAAVDETLTGRENLELVGILYHLGKAEARRRADDLLERFDLTGAGHRVAKTYSGGMRRRLDLAASLVGRPTVLFLDEPTTGLDPRGRFGLWEVIREIVNDGTTVLLTTQYMEEAEQLAHRISVIDIGRVIAEGTADQLKDQVGGEILEFRVADRDRLGDAVGEVFACGIGAPQADNDTGVVRIPVGGQGSGILATVATHLANAGIDVTDLAFHRPSLDDVFLALTGHAAEEAEQDGQEKKRGRQRRRGGQEGGQE